MKYFAPFLFIFFFIPFISAGLSAQSVQSLNEQATQEYNNGKYEEALRIWYGLLEEGNSDPDLFYNIGNAEAMKGNVPNAILHYERAIRYRPGDEKFQNAIGEVRGQIKNAAIPVNSFFLTDYSREFLALLRPGYWAFFGIIFLMSGAFCWLASIHGIKKFNIKKINYRLLFGVGVLLVLIAVASYSRIYRKDEAIIFSECDFREAPSQESPLTRSLHPGEKIAIIDELSGWYKVNLVNLDEGWIQKDCFIRIQ